MTFISMFVIFQTLITITLTLPPTGQRFIVNFAQLDSTGNTLDLAVCNSKTQIDFLMSDNTLISKCNNNSTGQCQIIYPQQTQLFYKNKNQIRNHYALKNVFVTNRTFYQNVSSQIIFIFANGNEDVWVIIPVSYNQKQFLVDKFVINIEEIKPYAYNEDFSEARHFNQFISFIKSDNSSTPITTFSFLNSLDYGKFFHVTNSFMGRVSTYLLSEKIYRITSNPSSNLKLIRGVDLPVNNAIKIGSSWDKLCFGSKIVIGVILSDIYTSYPLWLNWFAVLIYTVYVMSPRCSSSNQCFEKHFFKNKKTSCAFYSLFYLQHNAFFTRLSRSSIIMLNYSIHSVVSSVIMKYYGPFSSDIIVVWVGVAAFACSIPFPFLLGHFFLSKIYSLIIRKYQLQFEDIQNIKKTMKEVYFDMVEDLKEKIETLYFWYYVIVAYLFIIFCALSIYLLGNLAQEYIVSVQKKWTGSVCLAFALDWFVFDPVMTYFVGRRQFYKRRGFYYEYQMGQLYKLTNKY